MKKMRIIGVLVLIVSLVFAVIFSLGSTLSTFYAVMAYASLFSLASAIGIFFLRNLARIYSAVFLCISVIAYLPGMVYDYSKYKFLPSLVVAIIQCLVSLVLAIFLFSSKVKEQFK